MILHSAFGTTGTATAPFDLGRTTTHEIGHWLNLRHIWGDDGTGCAGSDFVADTPNQGGPNYGKPTFPQISCGNGPNGDMFVNFMDYVDDAAMVMFTAEQTVRMQAALDSNRSTLGVTRPCAKLPLKDQVKDAPKDLAKDLPKDGVKDSQKDLPKDPPKDLPKDLPKDPIKEHPKDLPKETAKDQPKDLPKDLPKDPIKEHTKEILKDVVKDLPKDGPKDLHKEPPKDLPKDSPKDLGKDLIKDPPKDQPKELTKDVVKDLPKDRPKELIKDFPKEGAFDPQKPPIADGPKNVFDPPKGLVEPPIDLGPGNLPFVLGTGAAAAPGAQAVGRQQSAALIAAYTELLAQFARLHAAGMLDASGVAAWQQAVAAYQQLIGS